MIESFLEIDNDIIWIEPGAVFDIDDEPVEIICVVRPGLAVIKPHIPPKHKSQEWLDKIIGKVVHNRNGVPS